jgi:hypothetical protein
MLMPGSWFVEVILPMVRHRLELTGNVARQRDAAAQRYQ